MGRIYLLCFCDPTTREPKRYKHAGHYLGYVSDRLRHRLKQHRGGGGGAARLMQVVKAQGLCFDVVRKWEGTRKDERYLKNLGSAARLCPRCNPGNCQQKTKLREIRVLRSDAPLTQNIR